MKLIIDIPEEVYDDIREGYYNENLRKMAIAIGNGIPLKEKENENESERMD